MASQVAPAPLARETWWAHARDELDGLPGGQGLNMAYEAVDRHARGSNAGRVAFRWVARDGSTTEATYADLAARTNRFANVLRDLGVGKGDRVFTLLGRVPELYVTVLGALKNTSVVSPLFSVFGPDPIHQRIWRGDGRVLVTTPALYHRKVAPIRDALPDLEYVLLVGSDGGSEDCALDFGTLMEAASPEFTIPPTDPEDMALLHFTSGTTGTPKGAIHVHGAVVAHHATAALALDLHGDDVFWCTADPGWVTGVSYGIVAPLTHGATIVVDEADFDAARWYRFLQDQRVNVWYTAPTAIRMLMRTGAELASEYDLSQLRFVASVGEALAADAVEWGRDALGTPIHDNWWQTETGGIMIANSADVPVRAGSMGRPLPGVEATILARGANGRAAVTDGAVREVEEAGVTGEIALRPGWPSMFRGYLHDDERYSACFAGGWYLTGDAAHRDAEGWFWFDGRADDVIKSAGHLIGPVEVERALLDHPAVVEAGVIGVPDEVAGEVVQAYVSLRPGVEETEDLRSELLGHARKHLGPAVAPRSIVFDAHLPKTKSGKIMRRLLRARALGLPEGDLSMLEDDT